MVEGDAAVEEAILGSVEMTEADLKSGIIEASGVLRARWLYIVVFGGIAAACGATGTYGTVTFWISTAIVMLPLSAYLLLAPRFRARSTLAALASAGDNRVHYRLDRDGIAVRTTGATGSFAYRTLATVRENDTILLLGDLILPKRAFTADDLERVRGLLGAQLKVARGLDRPTKLIVLWLSVIFGFFFLWQFVLSGPR